MYSKICVWMFVHPPVWLSVLLNIYFRNREKVSVSGGENVDCIVLVYHGGCCSLGRLTSMTMLCLGKSAALGLAMAAAVAYGYSNIFVTSPSPENLKTLFEFIFKGFDALNYEEHMDYGV